MSTPRIIAHRYEISHSQKDLLGRGGMGHVYRATDTQTGELVAVKALDPAVVARDPDILERFTREGEALRQLNHPNIVRMVAAVEEEGQHYLVMEYVAGGSLADLLAAQGRLPAGRVVEIALDLADAFTRAHRLGIIHRDLKPANVLLAEDGTPRLTDFGLAHVVDSPRLTQTGILVGSVGYVSPEACNGETLDARADIWAFGVMLYEMLTGELPFVGATLSAALAAILTQPVPDLVSLCPDTPGALVDLVYRMLEKDCQQRVPSVRLVGAELEAILKDQEAPTSARFTPGERRTIPSAPTPQPQSFLDGEEPVERPVFVTRERELAQLDGFLSVALAGQGHVVFVAGEAGQGKTALVQEFARRAQVAHPDLVAASGYCSAYTGMGDPYLPFREILGLLTGDVEARWAARAISQQQARRLWDTLPLAVQALVEDGPDLIDRFVPGAALAQRATAFRPWPAGPDQLRRLKELVELKAAAVPGDSNLQQGALFEQVTRVLWALAHHRPLLLVLDDLHWSDSGSTSLLFHLGRRIGGSRVLIVGTYRPAELALARSASLVRPSTSLRTGAEGINGGRERHPLEPVLNEFKRQFGDIEVDLGQAEGQQFVEAFLDTQPNRLGDAFRRTLYQKTRGHPLSTVELLRDMQERGDLVMDQEGQWVEGRALDWEIVPKRVEAVFAERVGRLAEPAREALQAASVQGEAFTAEVVARVLGADEREMVRWFSKLDREHHLVSAQGMRRLGPVSKGGQHLSVYRFQHLLLQNYLYNSLDPVERVHLHQEVGTALEELYGKGVEEVTVQLAHHFQEAGVAQKAVGYLSQAGDRARGLYAHDEAIDCYQRALTLLKKQADYERAAQTLMKLGLVYTAAFEPEKARQAYQQAFTLWKPLGDGTDWVASRLPPAVLHVAVGEPVSLDPGQGYDTDSHFLQAQLFEGLVEIGVDQNVLPAAAARWEVIDGGIRYIFYLRKDSRWSDGTPVTAKHFEYAWRRNLDPAKKSPAAHLLYDIQNARAFREGEVEDPQRVGVKALGDYTLEVRLEGPTAYLPFLLAHPVTYPLPDWAIETHQEAWTMPGNMVTNGAYELLEWERGKRLLLRRNPYYRGRFTGNAEQVECRVFTDYELALQAYASHAIDMLDMATADAGIIARAQAAYGQELILTPMLNTNYLIFRADLPPFNHVQVRQAFVHAVDRGALTKELPHAGHLPATGGFVPPGMPGHSPNLGLGFDPQAARRLLALAGYPEGRGFPNVTWLHTHGLGDESFIPYMQEAWYQNLGLSVEAETLAWDDFLTKVETNPPHLMLGGWIADYPDPDNFLRVVFHSIEGMNEPRWHNVRFNALVEEATRVTDPARRMRLYREADQILVAEKAIIMPLSYGREPTLVKPWVTDFCAVCSYLRHLKDIVVDRKQG